MAHVLVYCALAVVPTTAYSLGIITTTIQVSLRMEQEAGELEVAAHPALDALTKHINSINLEHVRRIKNKLARLLNNKVEKLKEILEGLLDDDSDLRNMNLTARRERECLEKERELAVERVGVVFSLGGGDGACICSHTHAISHIGAVRGCH